MGILDRGEQIIMLIKLTKIDDNFIKVESTKIKTKEIDYAQGIKATQITLTLSDGSLGSFLVKETPIEIMELSDPHPDHPYEALD